MNLKNQFILLKETQISRDISYICRIVYIICKILDIHVSAFIIYWQELLIFIDLCYTLYSHSMLRATHKHNDIEFPWLEDTT